MYVIDFDVGIIMLVYEDYSGDSLFIDGGVVVDLYVAIGFFIK